MEEELGRDGFDTVHKIVDVNDDDVYVTKKFHHDNWKKEVDILTEFLHVNIIIDLMIDLCLTFH